MNFLYSAIITVLLNLLVFEIGFAQPEILATVLKTNGKSALIDKGARDGIRNGDILNVHGRIGKEFEKLFSVIVVITTESSSGVRLIEDTSGPLLKEGDLLIWLSRGRKAESAINPGIAFVNRYIWRGLNVGDAPSIQPSLSFLLSGLEFGVWAAYSLTDRTDSDEIDTWMAYTFEFENSAAITAILTDYYFPNAGLRLFNFSNHKGVEGPGAHTLEAGLGIVGPKFFPISLFGYINVYNDRGKNIYFQMDYSCQVKDTDLNMIIGATTGSVKNPDYYGADDFKFIKIGVKATREVRITNDLTLPIFVSYQVNPNTEIAYVVFGVRY